MFVLEGLPAGMRVSTRTVDLDLRRRQHGYGSGRRMQIERDRVRWIAGIRYGRTLGSPVGFAVDNRDWENWTDRMSVERIPADRRPKPITRARPGHIDLAGALMAAGEVESAAVARGIDYLRTSTAVRTSTRQQGPRPVAT